jgi:hypothetical protein
MLIGYILSWLSRPATYVWRPELTLDDPRIVSQLTDAFN